MDLTKHESDTDYIIEAGVLEQIEILLWSLRSLFVGRILDAMELSTHIRPTPLHSKPRRIKISSSVFILVIY